MTLGAFVRKTIKERLQCPKNWGLAGYQKGPLGVCRNSYFAVLGSKLGTGSFYLYSQFG
jgi:hypothetical protein